MKILISILILVVLGMVFLPIYNGKFICGIDPEKGCTNDKINLIDYIQYKNR